MVTSPHNQNCGGRCGESAWGEWGSVLGAQVKEAVWGVEKCGEGCKRVYGVSGEVCWRARKG